MPITKADRSEVLSLLGKLTTTLDAVGRSVRDVNLVLRAHPEWDSTLVGRIEGYRDSLKNVLATSDVHEGNVVAYLNSISP